MLTFYVFALVLGGGFLAVSLMGDVLGGDADLDLDLDVDADAPGDAQAAKVFSLRTVVYGLFGFGAVGTALSLLGTGAAMTAGSAAVGGVGSAALIHLGFEYLRRTETGAHAGEATFVGLPGTVTLPLSGTTPGQVAVERGGRRTVLRALPHRASGGADPAAWRAVVIVEMEGGVAQVAPLDEELTAEP